MSGGILYHVIRGNVKHLPKKDTVPLDRGQR